MMLGIHRFPRPFSAKHPIKALILLQDITEIIAGADGIRLLCQFKAVHILHQSLRPIDQLRVVAHRRNASVDHQLVIHPVHGADAPGNLVHLLQNHLIPAGFIPAVAAVELRLRGEHIADGTGLDAPYVDHGVIQHIVEIAGNGREL